MPVEGYAVTWTAVVIAAAIGVVGMGAMLAGSFILAPRRPSAQKGIAYESGIPPTPLAWTQFTVRYYIFAILFLIFDVEAVFLFPWTVVFLELKHIPAVFYEMLLFMGILFFGILYGWRKGALQWR